MFFSIPRLFNEYEEATREKPVESAPIPYKQGTNSVPHLFVDKPDRISTEAWASLLTSSPATYKDCELVSLTWAKALESDLSHEFIQFIVEDKRNGVRTRVFSDRQNNDMTDSVTVGWNWSGEKNPSGQKDMPLPLKSLVFDDTNRPCVVELSILLATITARAPNYNIIRMCFWYAQSVFESAAARWGGQVKEWPFSRYAYRLVLWDYDFMSKFDMENSARQFKKQDIEGMSYQAPTTVHKPKFKTERYLGQVGMMLQDEEVQKDYEEALALDATEKVDPNMLKEAVESVQANATAANAHTSEDKEAGIKFTETILAEPESDQNLAAFEEAWQKNMRAEKNVAADEPTRFIRNKDYYFGESGQQEKQKFDRAMECFVGGVLRLLDENSASLPSKVEDS